MAKCPIHGDNCPGDDGGFFIDGNHPDDMFGISLRGGTMKGFIKNVAGLRQYAFIKGEDGIEYFFHKQDFDGFWDDLVADVQMRRQVDVTFEPVPSPKGPRAAEVVRIDNGV